jgi:hypothetical protein
MHDALADPELKLTFGFINLLNMITFLSISEEKVDIFYVFRISDPYY